MEACNFIKKETPTEVFSCEYCEIFKKRFFKEHLQWLELILTLLFTLNLLKIGIHIFLLISTYILGWVKQKRTRHSFDALFTM